MSPSQQRRLPSVLYKRGVVNRQRKTGRRFAGEHVSDQRTAHRARRSRRSRSIFTREPTKGLRNTGPHPRTPPSVLKSPRGLSNLQSWHGAFRHCWSPALTLGLNGVWSLQVASPHSCPCVGLDMRFPKLLVSYPG
ncbi:hypothetical protein TASIC1_0009028300 [Trichoderma asperellum]|uniref:Uncharacterized protein n=1 Tax=Trichoderma asperellum TaxID=101201 RepID=A0A6V8R1I1_TRIAP|nr:hypothetical protein TASIC1_0009028300 [Trichoderma asperellum]